LLAFSRKQVLQPRVVDLNEVLAGVQRMLARLIGEDIQLTASFSRHPVMVRVDPGQIEQVMMNLALNARDAMPRGGQLEIVTSAVFLDEARALERFQSPAGQYAMLAVRDTGIGMDAEVQSQIFEPFFTTKEVGRGTGLGLATVYGIVKQSGGSIEVASEKGKGTTFQVYLPLVADAPVAYQVPGANARRATGGSETILLVEDEPAVRKLVGRMLRHLGYTVLDADSGHAALEMLARHSGRLDLLVTDVVMAGMSGWELAGQVRRLQPAIKALFMSGYTSDEVVRRGIVESSAAFLQKPFSIEELGRKVRETLAITASA
jgi:two-component system cell cycle sensor histidine kinase/response regulator CckA